MSDSEHTFEHKADAGASKTFPQQAGTIRKNGYIVIKNRPCKSNAHAMDLRQVLCLGRSESNQALRTSPSSCGLHVSLFALTRALPVSVRVGVQVVEVSTSKTGKHGHAKCHFVGIDIFTGKKLEDIVPSSHNCDVPEVTRVDYQLIDISEDGFVSLLMDNGGTKDDLRLPTDEQLLTQLKDGFGEGKDLVLTVMSAMGEEQICALKDIGPK